MTGRPRFAGTGIGGVVPANSQAVLQDPHYFGPQRIPSEDQAAELVEVDIQATAAGYGKTNRVGVIPSINAGRRSSSVRSARLCAGFFFLNAGEGEVFDINSGHDRKGRPIVTDDLPLPGDGLYIGEGP